MIFDIDRTVEVLLSMILDLDWSADLLDVSSAAFQKLRSAVRSQLYDKITEIIDEDRIIYSIIKIAFEENSERRKRRSGGGGVKVIINLEFEPLGAFDLDRNALYSSLTAQGFTTTIDGVDPDGQFHILAL